jgi:uncharacterized membrane protein
MGIFGFLTKKEAKNELEGLDRAQRMLDERFQAHQISNEAYMKQCQIFAERREKYEKKLGVSKYDKYN